MKYASYVACLATATTLASAAPSPWSLLERSAEPIPDINAANALVVATGLNFVHRGKSWSSIWGSSGKKCDMTKPTLPSDPSASDPLPEPAGSLSHVLIGRGTQNFTCDLSNSTAVPAAVGALATLWDASCVASKYMAFLQFLPILALALPNPPQETTADFLGLGLIGHHYFTNASSPVFNLDTAAGDRGYAPVSKKASVNAPNTAVPGEYGACPWLYLTKNNLAQVKIGQQTFTEVYRVNTASGNPPTTCQGMQSSFQIDYAAEYWLYD